MSHRFRMEPTGQLVPEERNAAPFDGRSGRFTLMSTSPDLVLLARNPAEGGVAGSPRVVLSGDAGGFPLPDLIAFLSQSRWSGVIQVLAPGAERSVFMREGEVRGATSDDPSERLGEVMVRLGHVERHHVEAALRDHPPSKVGRALVEQNLLQAHDLFKCVTHQVSEIFYAIVLCREGAFFLIDQVVDDKAGLGIQLSTQSLLMDSIRKIDELAHFRKRIPHGRLHVGRKRGSNGKLEEDEERVLTLLDGKKTLLELAFAAKLSEFDVTKVVFRLLEGGFAAISEQPFANMPGTAPEPAPPRAAAARREPSSASQARPIARVFNFIFREIRDEVAKQGMEREFIAAANAALVGQGLSTSPVLRSLAFEAEGGLPEARLLAAFERHAAELGADPLAAFQQALSDVMFFLLFQAGELLESRADEDLARRVKELLATLGTP